MSEQSQQIGVRHMELARRLWCLHGGCPFDVSRRPRRLVEIPGDLGLAKEELRRAIAVGLIGARLVSLIRAASSSASCPQMAFPSLTTARCSCDRSERGAKSWSKGECKRAGKVSLAFGAHAEYSLRGRGPRRFPSL